MNRTASPEQQARNDRVDAIVELFVSGYTVDFACEQGVAGGWTRADVLAVVEQRGWPLDGSGRLPLRMRRAPGRLAELRPRRRLVDAALPPKLEAIARYDETPRAAVAPPAALPVPSEPQPAARPRQPATSPADVSEAVERFLAERTVPAPDDQYLTAPELRDAYEAWRSETGSVAVTPRWFGIVLTAKYRKKQAVTKINGTKPNCYYGLSWKPAEAGYAQTPTEGAAPASSVVDVAGTAPDSSGSGHGYAGPDAQPQVSPSRSHSGEGGGLGASDAPAEPPAAEEQRLSDWELELLDPAVHPDDWVWDPAARCYERRDPAAAAEDNAVDEASNEVEKQETVQVTVPPRGHVDVLALGLDHAHPAVRAKAKRVQSAIDDLCTALARHRHVGGEP